jgi:hypothetical protein
MRASRVCAIGVVACASCSLFVSVDGLQNGDAGAADASAIDSSTNDVATDSPIANDAGHDAQSISAYAEAVLSDSPIAYWRLGDTGSIAADATSNHLDGTYGPTASHVQGLIAGDSDGAALFGGVLADGGNVVGIGVPRNALLEPVNAISIEFWMKPLTTNSAEIASYGAQVIAPYQPWDVQLDNNGGETPYSTHFYTSDAGQLHGTTTYLTNTIYHVVATFDGTTLRTYTNGEADGATAALGVLGNYGSSLGLGIGSGALGDYPFTGVVDEVAVYDHELKADRVAAHYSAGK